MVNGKYDSTVLTILRFMINDSKRIDMRKYLGEAPLTIGGWLFLIAARLIFGIANSGKALYQVFDLQPDLPSRIIQILSALLVVLAFAACTFLLKRHKAFPVSFIIFNSCAIVFNIFAVCISLSAGVAPTNTFWILSAAIPAVSGTVCIVYTLRSERVKKTFVFTWNEKLDQRLVDRVNQSAQT